MYSSSERTSHFRWTGKNACPTINPTRHFSERVFFLGGADIPVGPTSASGDVLILRADFALPLDRQECLPHHQSHTPFFGARFFPRWGRHSCRSEVGEWGCTHPPSGLRASVGQARMPAPPSIPHAIFRSAFFS